MAFLLTAFLLGLMGSIHCAGMCGPIALSLPLQGNTFAQKLGGGFLYTIGKAAMYAIMGFLFGLLGQGFVFIGFQKWIAIVMGIIMILSVVVPSLFHSIHISFARRFLQKIRAQFSKLFTIKSKSSLLFLGILNALLPCGLVYLAIAGSIGTGNAVMGMLFMFCFGLGTIPMLLTITLAGNMFNAPLRISIQKKLPIVIVIIGILFILRGLTLGIPYISPSLNKMNPQSHKTGTCTAGSVDISKSCCHDKK